MPTLLLKSNNSKRIKERQGNTKEQLALKQIEENNRTKTIDRENSQPQRKQMVHLPPIYQTETLIQKRKVSRGIFGEERKEERYRKITARKMYGEKGYRQKEKNKENSGSKTYTEDKQGSKDEDNKVYHNFINRKKDKKNTYMRKIIEKVVSEDIEPWNLQTPQGKHKNWLHCKFSALENRVFEEEEWEREVLGEYNCRLEPF